MRVFGAPVRVHPLLPVMAGLAVALGEWERLIVVSVSLLAHELGHLLAAKAAGVEVVELELLPLGGAVRLRGAWEMRPAQLFAVAMAGPLVNLVFLSAATALKLPIWINANLILLLFNLLPALPLDGGRALAGLLSMRIRLPKAVRVAVWGGRAVSAALMGFFISTCIAGRPNITFLLASSYMFACGRRELLLAEAACVASLADRARELERERALPMRFLAVPATATAREVALRLAPRRLHVICPYDASMRPVGRLEERELLDAALGDGDRPVGGLAR